MNLSKKEDDFVRMNETRPGTWEVARKSPRMHPSILKEERLAGLIIT
jgi:hypothetical protein